MPATPLRVQRKKALHRRQPQFLCLPHELTAGGEDAVDAALPQIVDAHSVLADALGKIEMHQNAFARPVRFVDLLSYVQQVGAQVKQNGGGRLHCRLEPFLRHRCDHG